MCVARRRSCRRRKRCCYCCRCCFRCLYILFCCQCCEDSCDREKYRGSSCRARERRSCAVDDTDEGACPGRDSCSTSTPSSPCSIQHHHSCLCSAEETRSSGSNFKCSARESNTCKLRRRCSGSKSQISTRRSQCNSCRTRSSSTSRCSKHQPRSRSRSRSRRRTHRSRCNSVGSDSDTCRKSILVYGCALKGKTPCQISKGNGLQYSDSRSQWGYSDSGQQTKSRESVYQRCIECPGRSFGETRSDRYNERPSEWHDGSIRVGPCKPECMFRWGGEPNKSFPDTARYMADCQESHPKDPSCVRYSMCQEGIASSSFSPYKSRVEAIKCAGQICKPKCKYSKDAARWGDRKSTAAPRNYDNETVGRIPCYADKSQYRRDLGRSYPGRGGRGRGNNSFSHLERSNNRDPRTTDPRTSDPSYTVRTGVMRKISSSSQYNINKEADDWGKQGNGEIIKSVWNLDSWEDSDGRGISSGTVYPAGWEQTDAKGCPSYTDCVERWNRSEPRNSTNVGGGRYQDIAVSTSFSGYFMDREQMNDRGISGNGGSLAYSDIVTQWEKINKREEQPLRNTTSYNENTAGVRMPASVEEPEGDCCKSCQTDGNSIEVQDVWDQLRNKERTVDPLGSTNYGLCPNEYDRNYNDLENKVLRDQSVNVACSADWRNDIWSSQRENEKQNGRVSLTNTRSLNWDGDSVSESVPASRRQCPRGSTYNNFKSVEGRGGFGVHRVSGRVLTSWDRDGRRDFHKNPRTTGSRGGSLYGREGGPSGRGRGGYEPGRSLALDGTPIFGTRRGSNRGARVSFGGRPFRGVCPRPSTRQLWR